MPEDGLWPEHVAAVEAFLRISDLWRINPRPNAQTVFLGLDVVQAEAELRMAGIAVTPHLWDQIRIIEQGAKRGLNED
ncbi:DUF1799 domain-containing protein [uncultured Tateyamaria sp.]|uniref:DUF1799 domain-containing protein n=1 Tax=uncultured Tateyamaria sp. TaxID=455651 RepID=UPI002627697A|nr:DUF1799 domain-containing protein [uncultured Tateyamaria sp.]